MEGYQQFRNAQIAFFQEAKRGNQFCGDAYTCLETENYLICAICDGLGSGKLAYEASSIVISTIRANHFLDIEDLMALCNSKLIDNRGVVLSILKIDYLNSEVEYCNTGNINCIFYLEDGLVIRPVPKRGFLSGKKQLFSAKLFSFLGKIRFILFTDGLQVKNSLEENVNHHQSIKEVISHFRKFANIEKDDITLMVGDVINESHFLDSQKE